MEAVWIALALVTAVLGGWPATAGILRIARSQTVRAVDTAELAQTPEREPPAVEPAATEPTAETAPAAKPRTEVLRGGLLIGLLERAAVALAILAGQPIAIAYVVAIKGLGRYPELKDTPAASERFIIGTLASMLWAAGVAVLAKILLDIG